MLSVNLQKGDKVDLTKKVANLAAIFVACGWDCKSEGATMDADLSALLLDKDGKVQSKNGFIYYGNLGTNKDAVYHSGDNLTGAGDGDDEVVNVDLKALPAEIVKISFILNIYDAARKKQSLKDLDNAFIRAVDKNTNTELCKLEVKDMEGDTINFAHLDRLEDGSWVFHADGTTSSNFKGLLGNMGIAA